MVGVREHDGNVAFTPSVLDGGDASLECSSPSDPQTFNDMTILLAGSPTETAAFRPDKRELFATYGGGNPSLASMGYSGRSLMSMDLGLRSEDFADAGELDAIVAGMLDEIVDSDEDDDDGVGLASGIDDDDDDDGCGGGGGGDRGLRPIQSSDFVEKVLLAELKTSRALESTKGSEPSKIRPQPQDEELELCAMTNLTVQLGRISTGTLLKDMLKDSLNHMSSSDWAKDFSIDVHGMEKMDPSIFDSSNGFPPSHPSPRHASMDQSNPRTPDTNVVPPKSSSRSKRKIDESRVIEPTDDDVLLGRGGHTNIHPGNIRFREKALQLRPWYESCSKEDKYHVSLVLIDSVKSAGHRFLEKGHDGLWHEVIGNGARKKASQALRERLEGKTKGEKKEAPSNR
ncbi:hypothetical protein ACHAXA_009668 [Cyclostephanos tholiformis]|uniref:DUF6824 domain-containing protein n=1 Tax=Cyclostephanos tholiformis TaxID=382380 RepID=A0ABD3RGW1_9STRA